MGVSPDGSKVFVTGSSEGTTTKADFATLAYDASTGAKLWLRRYNGPGNNEDHGLSLALSPDGTKVLVTGDSLGSTSYIDFATVAYDTFSGRRLWVSRYDGPHDWWDSPQAIRVSPDGSKAFVTGFSWGRASFDYATVAYSVATGATLWASRYGARQKGDDFTNAVAVSPDGSKVFVTGQSYRTASRCDYATVAYDASTGARLWAARYDGPSYSFDDAHSVAVSPDGTRVFVTGLRHVAYATVAFTA